MPRQLRIQYPGAMYHVMSRGDRGERIFLDDVDRHDFIKTLAEACQKTDWEVHAYCTEESDPEAYEPLRGGWCFGSEPFRQEMLRRAQGSLGGSHAGQLHRQAADAKAERIIAEELQRNGWSEGDLPARRKKDPAKLAIAARLRRETTLPLKAIAARLWLGTSRSANGKLHAFMKETTRAADPGQLRIGLGERR